MNWDFLGFLATMVSIGVAISIPFGMFTLYRAWGRRVEGRTVSDSAEMTALRERVAALEETLRSSGIGETAVRLNELEERMDFAERLITDKSRGERIEGVR